MAFLYRARMGAMAWLAACLLQACGGADAPGGDAPAGGQPAASTADSGASSASAPDTAASSASAPSSAASSADPASAPVSVALIQDRRLIPVPQSGLSYPVKGVPMLDPVTGFQVTRVSDAAELTGDYGGTRSAQSLIVYSRYTPSNTTGEFVIVHGDNSTSAWIYRTSDHSMRTPLKFKPSLGLSASRSLGEINELRWDYSGAHPYRLYFVGRSLPASQAVGKENPAMSFYQLDIDPVTGAQGNPVLIRDFSADFPWFTKGEIMNDVEGDSSNDSRYWAWQVMDTSRGQGYLPVAVLAYDKVANVITGSLQRSCSGVAIACQVVTSPAQPAPYFTRPNMVEMSPTGRRVVVHWEHVAPGYDRDLEFNALLDGPKAFARDFTDPIRIGADASHSGWAWGKQGQELYVSQNNRNDWIEAVDITSASTARCTKVPNRLDNDFSCGTPIISYQDLDGGTWSVGMHFGKVYDRNKKGWVFLNTYDTSSGHWAKNQQLLVEVNDATVLPSRLVRLGSSYNLYFDYRSEGSGALDHAGNALWVTGNWGFKDGRADAIRVRLPTAWFESIR